VPRGAKWVYEIKHDGFRFICRRAGDRVRVFSRRGNDYTDRGLGPKTYKGLPDQQVIRDKLFDVCCDIVIQMPMALDEIASIAERATRLTRRFAHGVVKNYRKQFLSSDPCPCLSGRTVAACTGLRDR
jgi:hypothetical protein